MKRKKEREAEAIHAVKDALGRLTFAEAGPPMPAEQFEVLEARLAGFPLPAGYRWFLLHQNGGRPTPDRFSWRHGDEEVESGVDLLFGFDPRPLHDPARGVDIVHAALAYRSDLPALTVPIGFADRDDILVLFYHGEHEGQVWLKNWDAVTFATDEPNDPDAGTYFVADTFGAFLAMLRGGSNG